MTDNEKRQMVQAHFEGELPEYLVNAALVKGRAAVMQQRYGLVGWTEETAFPTQFEMEQCELAARWISRQGGYGEVTHKENGIDRTWASEDDTDILKKIPPLAKVM